MKQVFSFRKRGFTLVEILAVIVRVGILSGSLMLVMGKATLNYAYRGVFYREGDKL